MITQLQLIDCIYRALSECGPKEITVRQSNCVISAANSILEALGIEDTVATEGMGLSKWRASDDTGLSSRYMASVIWGGEEPMYEPADPSDFGRCYRLIRAVPGTREKLHLLKDKSKYWNLLVDSWDELERLYEEQKESEKALGRMLDKHVCWDKMRELQKLSTD